jgi:Cysteine-rich CPCC
MAFRNVSRPTEAVATYRCPCCGKKTLRGRAGFEICPVCFWEDDGQDDHDASDVRGGPNADLSLSEARRNYAEFGASDQRHLGDVRSATPDET